MKKSKNLDKQVVIPYSKEAVYAQCAIHGIHRVIPYSKEAVDNLLKIEREHNFVFGEKCYACPPGIYAYERRLEPCETLASAREEASKETKIAVALIRSREGRRNE